MREGGFVTHQEYQKHIQGEWRTVHDLWPHIRHYMTSYAQPGGFAPGSIPFAGGDGFLVEDNPNLFWDAAHARLGIHETTPTALVHINSVGGSIPALNLESGAEGELVTPDGQQLRFGHWNGVDTFTERMKIDAAGIFYISYLTTGSVIFAGAGDTGEIKQDNAQFFYDVNNHWLALGHAAPTNILHVSGVGTTSGWGGAYGGVVARFHCTENKHTSIVIDTIDGKDAVLAFSESGSAMWDIRNDASATDEFQIRCQVGEVNRTDFKIDNAGNIEILTGYLGIKSRNELRFYDNGNYVGFKAPALSADQIWVLPAEDGPANEVIGTDNAGNLIWRTHDELAGYEAKEHRAWEDSIAQDIHNDNISEGSVTQHVGAIDHDALLNTHANPYKLDDLAAPDDNTDLDFSTAKHGLCPKGTDVGDFLRDDGTWAPGGGGAATFVALTDTPANYAGAGGKVVVVNAAPNALEFVDTLVLAGVTVGNEGLHILDTNASHDLIIKAGSDLTADRIFTIMTGDAAKTLTIMGDCTIDNWFDQSVKQAASPTFVAVSLGQEGLQILDTGDDHFLIFKSAENLSANRILSIVTGDAARTVTLAGNPTLDDWFDQPVKQASVPTFAGLDLGTKAIQTTSKARIFLGANQLNITNATWTRVQLNTVDFDPAGLADVVAGYSITIPVAGVYLILGHIRLGTDLVGGKRYIARIKVGATAVVDGELSLAVAGGYPHCCVSGIFECAVDDVITLYFYHNAGNNDVDIYGEASGTATALQLHLLSETV